MKALEEISDPNKQNRNERLEMTNDITEIQKKKKNMRECYERLYAHKLDNLEEMNKFLERYKLPRRNQENQTILTD